MPTKTPDRNPGVGRGERRILLKAYSPQKTIALEDFPPMPDHPITKVLLAIDDSLNANKAAKTATALTASLQAELIVLNVVPYPLWLVPTRIGHARAPVNLKDYFDNAEARAWKWIDQTVLFARNLGVKKTSGRVVRSSGSTVSTIIQTAEEERVDLIVTGTRGLEGLKKALASSVSRGIIDRAACSVLVVK